MQHKLNVICFKAKSLGISPWRTETGQQSILIPCAVGPRASSALDALSSGLFARYWAEVVAVPGSFLSFFFF